MNEFSFIFGESRSESIVMLIFIMNVYDIVKIFYVGCVLDL